MPLPLVARYGPLVKRLEWHSLRSRFQRLAAADLESIKSRKQTLTIIAASAPPPRKTTFLHPLLHVPIWFMRNTSHEPPPSKTAPSALPTPEITVARLGE